MEAALARQYRLVSSFHAPTFTLACLCLISVSAAADDARDIPAGQNTPDHKAVVQHLSRAFSPLAATFDCAKSARGSFLKATTELAHVPSGDNVFSWTPAMTINLFPRSKETPAQIEILQKPEGNLLTEFPKGKITDQTLLPAHDGFPRMPIKHEAGGKPFDLNDAAKMKLFEGRIKIAPMTAGTPTNMAQGG